MRHVRRIWAQHSAYVVLTDFEKLRTESSLRAAAIKRAAVWWCLSAHSPTQLARHLGDMSQFEDMMVLAICCAAGMAWSHASTASSVSP